MNSISVKRWGMAIGVSLLFFAVSMGYIFYRRESLSFSTVNKGFGSAAILLAGFTLLIRFFMSWFRSFSRFMTIRRELGLMAFAFALVHLVISVFFVPNRFTLVWYQQEWVPIAFGALALSIWVYLAYLSRNAAIKKLGAETWKKYQRIGARIAFLLVYLHIFILKSSGWTNWFAGKEKPSAFLAHPQFVPESLLIFSIMTIIIIVKLIQIVSRKGNTYGNSTSE